MGIDLVASGSLARPGNSVQVFQGHRLRGCEILRPTIFDAKTPHCTRNTSDGEDVRISVSAFCPRRRTPLPNHLFDTLASLGFCFSDKPSGLQASIRSFFPRKRCLPEPPTNPSPTDGPTNYTLVTEDDVESNHQQVDNEDRRRRQVVRDNVSKVVFVYDDGDDDGPQCERHC